MSDILEDLNEAQRNAVTSQARHLRILAGAGSGKTRVLVRRIQWLLSMCGLRPAEILALTFTNKAAREISERLAHSLATPASHLWMGTFHNVCNRLLRIYGEVDGVDKNFTILDSADQLSILRRVIREDFPNEKAFKKQLDGKTAISVQNALYQINDAKEKGIRACDMPRLLPDTHPALCALYKRYESLCFERQLFDFSELLLRTVEILSKYPIVRAQLQEKFRAVLIDEFQDTNALQAQLIHLIVGEKTQLFVVGDDDQAIYGWRGAQVMNFLELEEQYPDLITLKLEENYRSTQTILNAANALIANNTNRLGKTLFTQNDKGVPIALHTSLYEKDEAQYVVEKIKQYHQAGDSYGACAILYRINAQSRVFEEALQQDNIPFRVYGGMRFYARFEIKNALSYLRLAIHPDDNEAFERVVNFPKRGIGEQSLGALNAFAHAQGISLYQAACLFATQNGIGRAVAGRLRHFAGLIQEMGKKVASCHTLQEALNCVIDDSGIYALYQQDESKDGQRRMEHLDELRQSGDFIDTEGEITQQISEFLDAVTLDSGEEHYVADAVQLMSLHSAKGLEFDNVFIVGAKDGIFPLSKSVEENSEEEERRLAYVGMTRARKRLHLSLALDNRNTHYLGAGNVFGMSSPSRFLKEIPEEYIERHDKNLPVMKQVDSLESVFYKGCAVRHQKFGDGVVMKLEGEDAHLRALVKFPEWGKKWLVIAYAKLEVIDD